MKRHIKLGKDIKRLPRKSKKWLKNSLKQFIIDKIARLQIASLSVDEVMSKLNTPEPINLNELKES